MHCQSQGTAVEMIPSGKAATLESMKKQVLSSSAVHLLLQVKKEGAPYCSLQLPEWRL